MAYSFSSFSIALGRHVACKGKLGPSTSRQPARAELFILQLADFLFCNLQIFVCNVRIYFVCSVRIYFVCSGRIYYRLQRAD